MRSEALKDGGTLAKAAPETIRAFSALLQTTTKDGALSHKTKELIAFALGIASHCEGCLAHHAHALVKAGATREEVVEAIGVAISMGGGPSSVYGALALKAYDTSAQG
ncbi:MAG: hypothetical protein A3K15_04750 [Candidatus Edwardsbacteria bacterium GWE2_54_12]|nr:MAG: hypothetical protein A3K15_04750 [Candidatus Edwardsbacteria bacterium GWE2_54_12]